MFDELKFHCTLSHSKGGFLPAVKQIANVACLPGIVRVCMCVCVCMCIYICVCIYICICVCMYVLVGLSKWFNLSILLSLSLSLSLSLCVHVCVHVCVLRSILLDCPIYTQDMVSPLATLQHVTYIHTYMNIGLNPHTSNTLIHSLTYLFL